MAFKLGVVKRNVYRLIMPDFSFFEFFFRNIGLKLPKKSSPNQFEAKLRQMEWRYIYSRTKN